MSSFTKPLIVSIEQKEYKGRGFYTLVEPFEYHVGYLGSGSVIEIPTGFMTDCASIPGLLRTWFPTTGKASKAAVVHDYILYTGMYDKKMASEIFLEAMVVLEVSKIKRTLMYWATRYWPWVSDVTQDFAGHERRPAERIHNAPLGYKATDYSEQSQLL